MKVFESKSIETLKKIVNKANIEMDHTPIGFCPIINGKCNVTCICYVNAAHYVTGNRYNGGEYYSSYRGACCDYQAHFCGGSE